MKQYKITQDFPSPIVKDFSTFLDYCEKNKPLITKTQEFITRKAVYDINQRLTNPHEGLTDRNNQNHYAQIHLFYHLALNGDLFTLDWSKKSKPYFAPNTQQVKRFKALNTTERYLFLFQCFYVYSNFSLIGQEESRFSSIHFLEDGFRTLANAEANKPYGLYRSSKMKDKLDLNYSFIAAEGSTLLYGQYFGLWQTTTEQNVSFRTRTLTFIESLTINSFGKDLLSFLLQNAPLMLWNQPSRRIAGDRSPLGVPFDEEIYQYYEEDKDVRPLFEKMEAQYRPFFAVMQPFFSEPIQGDFEIKQKKTVERGNFTLEVEMEYTNPKVVRTIQLGSDSTLEELHYAIIDAVDFDDDHLYAFYMDKNRQETYNRWYEHSDPPFASDFSLEDFDLSIDKRFYYTFDFGDNWKFVITVKAFKQTDKPLDKPKLIAQKGESPLQYPSYEEEW